MSKSNFISAAVIASGLGAVSTNAQACNAPPENKDMIVKMSMIPHEDVLPIEMKIVYGNGSKTIMTKEETTAEETIKVRCAMPTSYEFTINKEMFEAAAAEMNAVHISLDTNYSTDPKSPRGCVNVPIIDQEIKEGDTPDLVKLFFTLNETSDQIKARRSFIDIVDAENRNNEAWCYTVALDLK